MTKQNKPTPDEYEHSANMNWLRVLAFGAETVIEKTSNQSQQTQQTQTSAFIVMP